MLKLSTRQFTKEELEELWTRLDTTLNDIEKPNGIYTRHTSDLIKSLRDITENLILAGAIPEAPTCKDTARYVWKKLKERGIPYNESHFYKLFKPEQKREWQNNEDSLVKPSEHTHDFLSLGKIEGMGEVSRCGAACNPVCTAMMIDGRLFEQQELQDKEPELKPTKTKSNFEEQNEDFISALEDAINVQRSILSVWKTTDSNLTIKEKLKLKKDIFLLKIATNFIKMCYDRKNLIAPYTQHLLSLAYAEATQKFAGGAFLMLRMDLAKRKHGEAVKFFKKAHQFAKLLSGKQTAKSMKGKIRILNERYEPQNEKAAMDTGFSGQQCQGCKYWRVGYDQVRNPNWNEGKLGWKEGDDPKDKPDPIHEKFDTMLVCFHCLEVQVRKHYVLPKQVALVTIDSSSSTHQ